MVSASMSSRIEAFAQLLTLFIIFILVLAITYYVTRFVGNYQKNKMSGSNINILETMRISNTKYIQVVKIGSKVFAIAVAKDTVTYLCEFNEDELVYNESSSGKMLMNSESFKDILEKFKKDKPES
jgi:flagellar protein FliO/FliZ